MKKIILSILAIGLILLLSPIVLRKYSVPLKSGGKVMAIGTRPWFAPWKYTYGNVVTSDSKIFSMGVDLFEFPLFVHPFPDGKRYLCIFDNDTIVAVFVIDLNQTVTNAPAVEAWPADNELRKSMIYFMTNIVKESIGTVRLPTTLEVQETSSYIASLSSFELKRESYPCADFGIYRFYWEKEDLLSSLASNRTGAWP